jgi:IS1 family transposase
MEKVGLVSKIVDKLNENLLNVSLFVLIVLPNGQKSWIWYHNASLLNEFFAVQSKKCDTKHGEKIILVSKKCKKCFFTSSKRSFFFSLPFERIENFVE